MRSQGGPRTPRRRENLFNMKLQNPPKHTVTSGADMRAFHGSAALKKFYVNRVVAHRKADEIIAGSYWVEEGGVFKGCSAGCALHTRNPHEVVESLIGIPRILFKLNDRLFEGTHACDTAAAKLWPERFMSAAKPGTDLSMVWPHFALWLLVDEKTGVINHAKSERNRESIRGVAELYRQWCNGCKPAADLWVKARAAADARKARYSGMCDKLVGLMDAAK